MKSPLLYPDEIKVNRWQNGEPKFLIISDELVVWWCQ
jgi:hypothetical protein